MTGRGIDQLLAYPSNPRLLESYLRDAREYVELAENHSGALTTPVDPRYVWGAALDELDRSAPDARIINLETSVTTSSDFYPGKQIHYRMEPRNIGAITCARPDVCVLANNHVMDFGRDGLLETLEVLRRARLRTCGAGHDLDEARAPARVSLPDQGELLTFSLATDSSGVPSDWAAGAHRPGVNLLVELSPEAALRVAGHVRTFKRPGDLAVASIHWGGNWGYEVPAEQVQFARHLIDGGVDLVHGHSSHHPRPIEVYRGKLILYGCGDFINDYEGISGYEAYRPDLRPMYFAAVEPATGRLQSLRVVTLQTHRLSLRRASQRDADWLIDSIREASRRFETLLPAPTPDGTATLTM